MQGAYVLKSVTGVQELEKLLKSHVGGVYLESDERLIKLMTSKQKEEYLKAEAVRNAILGDSPSSEVILVLEELKKKYGEEGSGRADWMVARFRCFIRPATKKELEREVRNDPSGVYLQATSIFGNEYGGPLSSAPLGRFSVVGPDPKLKRSWFATISWSEKKNAWVVR